MANYSTPAEMLVINGSTSEQALISLVIPVFNQELIIMNHLVGAFKATSSYFEVVIVDDASSD